MSDRSHLDFLEDILGSIDAINGYVSDMDYDEFKNDRRTVDAVVRNFEVIGEAANNLPDALRERHESVEWRGVINFRNIMIHDYFRVDTSRVWDTIRNNLPDLEEQINAVLDEETDGET